MHVVIICQLYSDEKQLNIKSISSIIKKGYFGVDL